ncbi:hypothetical protein B484DRAFT_391164 [Ochromonadaceae sp. CCMP2298]|nr:hypothetical protein B484DRAFT_391164 [Ochromonadaceae sp. CCMP2298]
MRNPENREAFAVEGGELTQAQLKILASQPLTECPAISSDEDSDSEEAEDGSATWTSSTTWPTKYHFISYDPINSWRSAEG